MLVVIQKEIYIFLAHLDMHHFDKLINKLFYCFYYVLDNLSTHNMIIFYLCIPYFHVSNSALFFT